MKNISIIILAAGASSRMGKIKQLLPWKNGTLLSNALDTARASRARSIILVTGANAVQIVKNINQEGVDVVNNERWTSGMGSSIVCGMQYIKTNIPNCNGILLMVADQPMIDITYLNELIEVFGKNQAGIIATKYNSGPGVPAVFDNKYFDELVCLNKDYGARDIISANLSTTICLDPAGKQKDIDTMEEYELLIQQYSKDKK